MKATIYPGTVQNGSVLIPPSKSMAHRAIVCAALAQGRSIISNLDYSDDISATIEGMRQLGASIETRSDSAVVVGIGSMSVDHAMTVDCAESGSTLRFLIPLFSLSGQRIRFVGKNRLLKRPQSVYQTLFQAQGLFYQHDAEKIEIEGAIRPGEITLRGDVSSQFISGLLFALPLCAKDSKLIIQPPFESRSYVALTIEMLEKFGITIRMEGENTLIVPGNQQYRAQDVKIEGDYSQLAFFAALGALNGPLEAQGLRLDSLQGDRVIVDLLKAMGVRIQSVPEGFRIDPSRLNGTRIDLADCPDLGPILMVLATFADGKTVIENAGRLRLKESDRIAAMESELKKVGAKITSTDDTITIEGPTAWQGGQTLSGHRDHRIVMSLAIGATLADRPITISEAQSIAKSYPGFFSDLKALGIQVEESEE